MKIYTNEEYEKLIIDGIRTGSLDVQQDESGQFIIYTNVFEWNDGTLRSKPDRGGRAPFIGRR